MMTACAPPMTAHWMKQMGWDVAVLTLDMASAGTETGPWQPRVLALENAAAPAIDGEAVAGTGWRPVRPWSWIWSGAEVTSPGISRGPGMRSALAWREAFGALPAAEAVVFTSGDGVLARLAAAEWSGNAPAPVLALTGGTAAWTAAGYPLERGATRMASAPDDVRLRAREQAGSVEDAMRAYLTWEIELVNQMATDDDQRFQVVAG